ncbi:MAG TPA: glycosyltransferase [Bryobacteraceae bacterium]|nr:glycosyltransferase [Bryobacteraceae bacterium]
MVSRLLQLRRHKQRIAQSGIFDSSFYLAQAPDAADPVEDYLTRGWRAGCNPHPLFDTAFYLQRNPDLAARGLNPLLHYLEFGGLEGRNPHPLFDGHYYLQQSPDLFAAKLNPLVHYLIHGWKEGRDPHPLFETTYYLQHNPDVAAQKINPLLHYVTRGAAEGRDPGPLFDSSYYVERHPDASGKNPLIDYLFRSNAELRSPHPLFDASFYSNTHPDAPHWPMSLLLHYVTIGVKSLASPHPLFDAKYYSGQNPGCPNPLRHYICEGARQGADPCELFDSSFYLEQYPEIAQASVNPLAHYLTKGAAAGYNPNPLFETSFYLQQNPDVAASGVNPLAHFVNYGALEGRMPNPFFDSRFYLNHNPDVRRAGVNPLTHYLLGPGAKEGRDPGPLFSTSRYVSEHPEVAELGINPLAHFLRNCVQSRQTGPSATVVLMSNRRIETVSSVEAANRVLESASTAGCHLLVLLGLQIPDERAVRALVEALEIDPHFGMVAPRQFNPDTGKILKLDERLGDPALSSLPREIVKGLPAYYIFPEIVSSCFLVRDSVVSTLAPLDENYKTLPGAILDYLSRARRCGFRCVVQNRILIPAPPEQSSSVVPLDWVDLRLLGRERADLGRARVEFTAHESHVHETLLARAVSTEQEFQRSLLIDARGLSTRMDGTAEAVLNLCDSFRLIDHEWNITVLAEPDAAEFHKLRDRYSNWQIIAETAGRYFTAALRPSQPWWLTTPIELHRMALFNFYCILDTIAWDIFPNACEIAATWDFISSHGDGVLYVSEHTRRHFATRFPASRETPGYVFYHSFDPDDYRSPVADPVLAATSDFIFVVGNAYEHKQVRPTVDLLVSSFPSQPMKVLGLREHAASNVEVMSSGQIPQPEIDRLFATAKLVVFPSLYEGFGFPVIRGLSYGRTVIARDSDLLREVAERYRGPGRLVGFRDSTELVDAVEGALGGGKLQEIPLGTALGLQQEPMDWKQVGAGVLQFLEERIRHIDECRWRGRERAVRQLIARSEY